MSHFVYLWRFSSTGRWKMTSDVVAYQLFDVSIFTFPWQGEGKTLNIYIPSSRHVCYWALCLTIFSVFPSQGHGQIKLDVVAYELFDVRNVTFPWQGEGKTLNIYIRCKQNLSTWAVPLTILTVFPSRGRGKVKSHVVAYQLFDVRFFTFPWQGDGQTLKIYIPCNQMLRIWDIKTNKM